MIKIVYFAKIREIVGKDHEEYELPEFGVHTITDVINALLARGEPYERAFGGECVLAAINHEMASMESRLIEDDELAFFPPVTGG